jgi:hypothetical protein
MLSGAREYYPGFEQVDEPHDFEKGIEADITSLYGFFASVLGDSPEKRFLLAAADFDNYLLALKGQVVGAEPVLMPSGSVSTDVIAEAAESGDTGRLPEYLKELRAAVAPALENGDPVAASREGEKAKWRYLLETAPSPEAERWVRLRIDRANIKAFARLRLTSLRSDEVSDLWIPGGTIEASRFESLFPEPFEDFLSFTGYTEWRGLQARGFERDMPVWKIDTALDSTLMDLIGESRSHFFDMMPLLYHIEMRERNARILRTIFSGGINDLPEDMLAESVEELLS